MVRVSERLNKRERLDSKPERSKINPLYFYIPKGQFDKFKSKHKAFVKLLPCHNSCALILEESKSFSEIKGTFLI